MNVRKSTEDFKDNGIKNELDFESFESFDNLKDIGKTMSSTKIMKIDENMKMNFSVKPKSQFSPSPKIFSVKTNTNNMNNMSNISNRNLFDISNHDRPKIPIYTNSGSNSANNSGNLNSTLGNSVSNSGTRGSSVGNSGNIGNTGTSLGPGNTGSSVSNSNGNGNSGSTSGNIPKNTIPKPITKLKPEEDQLKEDSRRNFIRSLTFKDRNHINSVEAEDSAVIVKLKKSSSKVLTKVVLNPDGIEDNIGLDNISPSLSRSSKKGCTTTFTRDNIFNADSNSMDIIVLNKMGSSCHQLDGYANYNLPILESEEISLKEQRNLKDFNNKLENNSSSGLTNLCEAFFISGLTPGKIAIPNDGNNDFLGTCKHKSCAELQAYTPTIVAKYPTHDSKNLEINFLSAKFCFTRGIKCCYCEEEDKIKFHSSYMTIITNHNGTKYYVLNYFYFVRYDQCSFKKLFGINIFNDNLNLEKVASDNKNNSTNNIFLSNSDTTIDQDLKKKMERVGKTEKSFKFDKNPTNPTNDKNDFNFKRKMELCEKFGFNDYVYVPFAASLVSKTPIASKIEKFLEIIVNTMEDSKYTPDNLNNILKHLINEIVIPPISQRVIFYLPYCPTPFEQCGMLTNNPPETNFETKFLLEIFSIENILLIHHFMLMEQRIILIGEEQTLISEVMDSFISLLYPFKWWHSYIPVLPESFLEYVRAMSPYLMGLEESLFNTASAFIYEEDNVYLVFIDKNYIDNSSNKKKKKLNKKSLL